MSRLSTKASPGAVALKSRHDTVDIGKARSWVPVRNPATAPPVKCVHSDGSGGRTSLAVAAGGGDEGEEGDERNPPAHSGGNPSAHPPIPRPLDVAPGTSPQLRVLNVGWLGPGAVRRSPAGTCAGGRRRRLRLCEVRQDLALVEAEEPLLRPAREVCAVHGRLLRGRRGTRGAGLGDRLVELTRRGQSPPPVA